MRRNQAIELLRLLAVFGVLAFHAPVPGSDIAYAGLAAFVVLSPLVDVQYNWERRRTPRLLAKTLLLPWAVWFCIYAALRVAEGRSVFRASRNLVSAIFEGPAPHLWFLPFIFVALVSLSQLKGRISQPVALLVAGILAVLSLMTVGFWRAWDLTPPWGRWVHATPMVFVGITLGLASRVPKAYLVLLPVLSAVAFVGTANVPGVSVPYVLGVALVLLANWLGPRLPARFDVEGLSRCVMGVYLVHVAWFTICWPLLVRFGYPAVVAAYLVALAGVYLVRKYLPALRVVL